MVNAENSRLGIMQMTDSLAAGGLERVAVNLANAMPRDNYRNYLCTTRSEGPLADLVANDVGRLCLERKRRFDGRAVARLVEFIRANEIQILHAHGTALFMADLASFFAPYPKVVWHDHFGRYAFVERPVWLYRMLTRRAAGVLAVNQPLADWSRNRLRVAEDRVWYVPNFVCEQQVAAPLPEVPGTPGRRIVCVANLRREKDHPNLINAMARVIAAVPDAHALLIGAQGDADYRHCVEQEIDRLDLRRSISWLGPRDDVAAVLRQCDIGILSSQSEGLPLSLLEYGRAGLPVVVTRVGQVPEVVDDGRCGLLVDPRAPNQLAEALLVLLGSQQRRESLGRALQQRVTQCYSADAAIAQISDVYEMILGRKVSPPSDSEASTALS